MQEFSSTLSTDGLAVRFSSRNSPAFSGAIEYINNSLTTCYSKWTCARPFLYVCLERLTDVLARLLVVSQLGPAADIEADCRISATAKSLTFKCRRVTA